LDRDLSRVPETGEIQDADDKDEVQDLFSTCFEELVMRGETQKNIFIHRPSEPTKLDIERKMPEKDLREILSRTREEKYSFDDLDTLNIMTSLKVKPFVILTGMS
jgi:hypothetical protein